MILALKADYDWRIRPRAPEGNPYASSCRKHLRRSCGACIHWTGKTLDDTGDCQKLGRKGIQGCRSAVACDYWSRK